MLCTVTTILPEREYWHYPEHLTVVAIPTVSHNEGLTILMRTVHLVLLRSAGELVKEVVLLDDNCNKSNLHKIEREKLGYFKGCKSLGSIQAIK